MKLFFFYIVFCSFSSTAFAQAADVNAIDLSGKMDTIERGRALPSPQLELGLGGFLNVGLKNSDQWEDFELIRSDTSRIRFGGPLLFDSTNNINFGSGEYTPQIYGDFDGDGFSDMIANQGVFFKGHLSSPYFDTASTGLWVEDVSNTRAIDFDEDGVKDILDCAGDHRVRVFKGGASFGKSDFLFATDSIQFPATVYPMEVGKFNPHSKPMIVCYAGNKLYLVKQTGNSFSQDSVIVVSDSAEGGILVTNLYATDITGDGISDLIISDNYHIYIFKGGDDFGTYPLTSKTAFYTIKSPRLTDFTHFGFVDDFGEFIIRACGDLTGSGIPYIMVGGDQSGAGYNKSYAFFYAGGKALDSLYDGIIGFVNNGYPLNIDTLHSINSLGKTTNLINDRQDENFNLYDLDFLMSHDCEKIPHKTNPNMVGAVSSDNKGFDASCYPSIANKFTKIQITSDKFSEATITVFNLLGQSIQKRIIQLDPGENSEFFNTSEWTNGTYIVTLESSSDTRNIKFLVDH